MYRQQLIFLTLLLFCVASFGVTGFLSYRYAQDSRARENYSFELAERRASKVASQVNEELARLKILADRLAKNVSRGDLESYRLSQQIEQELSSYSNIFGLGVAYEPYSYLPRMKLYAPYYKKSRSGRLIQTQIEELYDYSDPTIASTAWYHKALAQTGGRWIEPYLNESAGEWLIEYRVPFYNAAQAPLGVLYVQLSLANLMGTLNAIDTGEEGFTYILSKKGQYISHPSPDFFQESLFDKALNNRTLRRVGIRALLGESFFIEEVEPSTGQDVWLFHKPIRLTDWSLGIVFDKTIGQERPHLFVRELILINLWLILSLSLLAALVLRVDRGAERAWWRLSIIIGVLFTLGIILIWYLEANYPPRHPEQIVLVKPPQVEQELRQVDESLTQKGESPLIRIPTGMMLETIGIVGTTEKVVSGYIWQKYPLDAPFEIEKGFFFTDVVDPLEGIIEEVYHFEEGGYELIGWFFLTTLRQEPTVEKFPLDESTIQVQLWPKSLSDRVVLVPDFEGYEFIAPSQKPGVVESLVLRNWQVQRAYFSYRYDDYNVSFGSQQGVTKNFSTPDLYFNVIIRRELLSPIVAYAITIVVVAALMFAILLVNVGSAFEVLTYAASLFFVVAISQVGLRDALEAGGVVYLEYGYILLYLIILTVSVNSMLYYSGAEHHLIQYKDNLLAKLLYWPLVTGAFLAITVLFFLPPVEEASTLESLNQATVNVIND